MGGVLEGLLGSWEVLRGGGDIWGRLGVILGPILGDIWGRSGVFGGSFGSILGPFWGLLGPWFWGHLSPFWGHFGVFWAQFLGLFWGTLGPHLGPFRGPFAALLFGARFLAPFGVSRGFGAVLSPFWGLLSGLRLGSFNLGGGPGGL